MRRWALIGVLIFAATFVVVGVAWRQLIANVAVIPGVKGCALIVTEEPDRRDCIASRTLGLASRNDLVEALSTLERARASDPRIATVCHPAMHTAARRWYKTARGRGWRTTIRHVSAMRGDCVAGFAHGTIEQVVADRDPDSRALQLLCQGASTDATFVGNCWHGVGHGLRRRNDVPGAVARCDRLGLALATANCLGGVFMEHQFRLPASATRADVVAQCTAVAANRPASLACWTYVSSMALLRLDMTIAATQLLCGTAQRQADRIACWQYTGSQVYPARWKSCIVPANRIASLECVSGIFAKHLTTRIMEPADAMSICNELQEEAGAEAARSCARSAGRALAMDRARSGRELERMCDRAGRDDVRAGCLEARGRMGKAGVPAAGDSAAAVT